MGFFKEYGRNMNAWIDCMSDLYTNGQYSSLTKFNLTKEDIFILRLENTQQFQTRCPDIFSEFIVCSALRE